MQRIQYDISYFKYGYRAIMLLHRNKDGCDGNAQRKSLKRISKDAEQWDIIVNEFKELQKTQYPDHRIYASVNMRDINKAINMFKHRQLDRELESLEQKGWFYQDIQNSFFSCFMNPGCKAQKFFLIDCDTEYELEKALELHSEKIIFKYPTRNGWHVITDPFDCENSTLIIKRDDLLYIC